MQTHTLGLGPEREHVHFAQTHKPACRKGEKKRKESKAPAQRQQQQPTHAHTPALQLETFGAVGAAATVSADSKHIERGLLWRLTTS